MFPNIYKDCYLVYTLEHFRQQRGMQARRFRQENKFSKVEYRYVDTYCFFSVYAQFKENILRIRINFLNDFCEIHIFFYTQFFWGRLFLHTSFFVEIVFYVYIKFFEYKIVNHATHIFPANIDNANYVKSISKIKNNIS